MCPNFTLTEMTSSGPSKFLDIMDQDFLNKFDANLLKPQS